MEDKQYVAASGVKKYIFPNYWVQSFAHEMAMNAAKKEKVLESFESASTREDVTIRKIGYNIVRFLVKYIAATREQLIRYFAIHGLKDPAYIDAALQKFERDFVINRFTIASRPDVGVPDDAFAVYCLDYGARYIINAYMSRITNVSAAAWMSTNAQLGPVLVTQKLLTTELYIALLQTKKEITKDGAFEPEAEFSVKKGFMQMSAHFCLMNGCTPQPYLVDIIPHMDIPSEWRKKVNEQIFPFLQGQCWNRYFPYEPKWLFITENVQDSRCVAEIFGLRTDNAKPFYILDIKNLMLGFDEGIFYKYDPAKEKRIVGVKLRIFYSDAKRKEEEEKKKKEEEV